jgi:multidrug efflux pump subunit AcrB
VNFGRELSYPYFLRENRKDITHIQVPGQAAQNQSLPEGVSEVSGNVFSENLQSILVIFAFGLLLLYLVMGFQFESFGAPLLVLLVMPVAMVGIVLGLFVTGQPFSFFSGMGVLILLGLTVNAQIILVEQYRKLSGPQGRLGLDQLLEASAGRLIPILITTLTTLLAMVPFAIDPYKSSSQDNLAIAVIFGLLLSLFFSLFFFPWIYSWGKRKDQEEDKQKEDHLTSAKET